MPACSLCPRLVAYREENRSAQPSWHNAPAPAFGPEDASLLIVGLAPGRMGANRTGRVFTGDAAGRMLFETLIRAGFALGTYNDDGADDVRLLDCRITNAVLCAPPGNRPTPDEQATCRPHLASLIRTMPRLRVIVTLGHIARRNVLLSLGARPSAMCGGHGFSSCVAGISVINSYHCSRLNLNTGRLTADAFGRIFAMAREVCDDRDPVRPGGAGAARA